VAIPASPIGRSYSPEAGSPLESRTLEIRGKCAAEIEQAGEARDYTRALLVGGVVTLIAVEFDKYRMRIDAYVSIDGRNLGAA
jgi:hypothetical protein